MSKICRRKILIDSPQYLNCRSNGTDLTGCFEFFLICCMGARRPFPCLILESPRPSLNSYPRSLLLRKFDQRHATSSITKATDILCSTQDQHILPASKLPVSPIPPTNPHHHLYCMFCCCFGGGPPPPPPQPGGGPPCCCPGRG